MERTYNYEQVLGVTQLMQLHNMGKPRVMKILTTPGCPVLPRPNKSSPWQVLYGPYMKWFEKQLGR